jgi:hypothetical protein
MPLRPPATRIVAPPFNPVVVMRIATSALLLTLLAVSLPAQQRAPATAPRLTTPQEALGFAVGADYRLPTYTQQQRWWEKLARHSPRMKLDTHGDHLLACQPRAARGIPEDQ